EAGPYPYAKYYSSVSHFTRETRRKAETFSTQLTLETPTNPGEERWYRSGDGSVSLAFGGQVVRCFVLHLDKHVEQAEGCKCTERCTSQHIVRILVTGQYAGHALDDCQREHEIRGPRYRIRQPNCESESNDRKA